MARGARVRWFLAALFLAAAAAGSACGDELVLKTGGRLEGRIVKEGKDAVEIETRFGTQRIPRDQIREIVRKATPEQELEAARAALAADDVEGRFALWQRTAEPAFKKARAELEREILALAPNHAGLNEALGRVLHDGRFVEPAEKERLVREAREAEMRAQGLVPWQGRFVTPEEKEMLERGMVQKDGRWMPEEEAKRMEGLARGKDGAWVPLADAHAERTAQLLAERAKKTFHEARRDHVSVFSDVSPEFSAQAADLLEKGFRAFAREFGTDEGLRWFGERRAEFVVFRVRMDYEAFLDVVAAEAKLVPQWTQAARQVAGVYVYDSWPVATTYVANRGESMTIAHCTNMLGHVLLNRYRCEGKAIPAFFDEAFAALVELELTGRNAFFTIGSGRYERTIRDDERAFFEDGKWLEPLRDAFRTRSDTPLDKVVRRDHHSLTQMDVAKGMALFQHWRKTDPAILPKFVNGLRDRWPQGLAGGQTAAGHPSVLAAVAAAFQDATGQDLAGYDPVLRQFAMASDEERAK